jgi:hypothetical protein
MLMSDVHYTRCVLATFVTFPLSPFPFLHLAPMQPPLPTTNPANEVNSHRLDRQHLFPRSNPALPLARHRPRHRRPRQYPCHRRCRRPNSLHPHPQQQTRHLPVLLRASSRHFCQSPCFLPPCTLRRHHRWKFHGRAGCYRAGGTGDGGGDAESVSWAF